MTISFHFGREGAALSIIARKSRRRDRHFPLTHLTECILSRDLLRIRCHSVAPRPLYHLQFRRNPGRHLPEFIPVRRNWLKSFKNRCISFEQRT
jgi:hypothetical protein